VLFLGNYFILKLNFKKLFVFISDKDEEASLGSPRLGASRNAWTSTIKVRATTVKSVTTTAF